MTPAAAETAALPWAPALAATALGAARTVPVAWLAGPLGGGQLPPLLRVALGALLAALLAPSLAGQGARALVAAAPPPLLALHLARELLIGISMGLVVSCAFRAAEAAGRLADVVRGASLAEALSPQAGERTSPLGALYLLLATVVFLELGGVPRLCEAVARSYDALPIGGGFGAAGAGGAAGVVALASARLIEAALGLAAPMLVAIWLTDLALAFVARAVPGIPAYFIGLPLKGVLVLGLVLVGLAALPSVLARGFDAWLALLERLIAAWQRR
jgi:flagellar biosynthetic protein FliR